MKKYNQFFILTAMLFTVAFCFSSCATVERESFTPRSHEDPPEGPGLFTGEDGEAVIFSK